MRATLVKSGRASDDIEVCFFIEVLGRNDCLVVFAPIVDIV